MTNEYQIRVVPEVATQEDRLKAYLAEEYGFDVRTIYGVRILKRKHRRPSAADLRKPESEGVRERAALR